MTIKDCIDIVDNLKPNQYTIKDKVMWLSFIEEIIINEVLKTHEGYDGRYDHFTGYSEDKISVNLIVPSPYDRLYTAFLKMKIDESNGETARYNNSAILYNSYMSEYRKHYNRTHMPLNPVSRSMMKPHKMPSPGLSEAEYENIKKDLTFILTEYFSDVFADDKLRDVVVRFAQDNLELLKGRLNADDIEDARQKIAETFAKVATSGKYDDLTGKPTLLTDNDVKKVMRTYAYPVLKAEADGMGNKIHLTYALKSALDKILVNDKIVGRAECDDMGNKIRLTYATKKELEEALKTLAKGTPIASVTIYGGKENWKAVNDTAGCRYGQVVNVNNAVITPNSKVDLQLSSEQMAIFYEKDLAFVAENENGVVTIYCIGQIPQNDYTIQATVTEVVING